MKYATRIVVDKSVAANRRLFELYEWHQEAWKLFPGRPRDKRDFLTRLDVDEYEFRFTVLSGTKPQKPDWCAQEWWNEKEMPQSFFEQKRYLFKVLANPTRTLSRRDPAGNKKKHGSHYAITEQEELKQWIIRKGEQCGFVVLDDPQLDISPPIFHRFYKEDKKIQKEYEGGIVGVEFKGALEVTNKESFLKAVREGIGRARGVGFGMLVLKPIA
ncbi:MAG: type I-E CRISPR-associated protein Cas6/Cse3/CasE [Candidatus Omnitrophota bacterium]|nr:type I-E CRISPR-associated protein Cas6/Cse3/CasE [Candidatus Omnitrophota bacterium]